MARGVVIILLVVIAAFLVFEMSHKDARAQDTDNLDQVLKNQELILDKLDTIDKKLHQIKMRIK